MKFTPFWDEGLSDEERARRVSRLFDSIERELVTTSGPTDGSVERTYILVPDPPPFSLDVLAGGVDIRRISWGVAGRAAATENLQATRAIAPDMLDLWSDQLYILAFAAKLPDDTTLGRWIEEVLRVEFGAASSGEMQVPPLPHYALMVFDCGDLVGEPPTEWDDLVSEPPIEIR